MEGIILDAYTLNPGDLNWSDLESLADWKMYDYTRPNETLERARDADLILTNKTVLSGEIIARLPKLKYIGVLATGYNVLDLEAAKKQGIVVTNIPAYSTDSVAQLVFAHLLNIVSQVMHHAEEVKKGRWCSNRDFSFWDKPLIELAGMNFGILGFGNIGKKVAQIAQSFGMNVLVATSQSQLPVGILKRTEAELFNESDVISLHIPLTSDTEKIINSESLALMKPHAILINTARGGLIDEPALAKALNQNRLFAAGLDVLSTEPPQKENPLLTARNCYITPHYAWATRQARNRLIHIATENVAAFLAGKPQNSL